MGITTTIKNLKDLEREQSHPIYGAAFKGLNAKEITEAMGDNELILIGIDESTLKDDNGDDAATSLNHEELAHGEDTLDGDKNTVEKDHEYYFGYKVGTTSPSDFEVRTLPQYANSRARQQFNQITRIIQRTIKQEKRTLEKTKDEN